MLWFDVMLVWWCCGVGVGFNFWIFDCDAIFMYPNFG